MRKSEAAPPASPGSANSASPADGPSTEPGAPAALASSLPSRSPVSEVLSPSQLIPAPVDSAALGTEDAADDDDQLQTVDTPSARSQPVDAIQGIPALVASPPSRRSSSPSRGGAAAGLSGSNPAVAAAPGTYPIESWDRYEFLGLLGQGGMGAVYKARDRRIRRTVALKFIRGGDERLTQRFMQEARAQSRVEHPGICKVLEVGEVEGKAYIAMQFVDGPSLQQARHELSLLDKVAVVKEAAEALHAAHEQGVIHRDIKPANIMVERRADGNWHPVVMDFGLARDTNESQGMTESGTVMGTAAFMSPEQARGNAKSLDRRTDVYSLGATLFDLLAGRPPFIADSMADTLLKVMLDEPPALRSVVENIPEALDIIVGKCLNKEASQRYRSALDFAEDLGRFLANRRIVGRRLSLYNRLKWRAQHNKPAFGVALILVATLLFLIGYGINTRLAAIAKDRQARRQAEIAQRLGQDIKDLEWMLRSARQLPLHNLDREIAIVRRRMARLQADLSSYGELGRSLGYYALGRGHMALHEYSDALTQLKLAVEAGNERPEVLYALGFVLGKLHEQALADLRMAGSGEWAKKRIKELEPQYLQPAISYLQRSQEGTAESAAYLEGLIAYHRGESERAIERAQQALKDAPWLYEAWGLIGDVYMQRGFALYERAQTEPADKEFAAAAEAFAEASRIGQSDAGIFESLTDAWRQRTAVAKDLSRPMDGPYNAALAASDKILISAPGSLAGPLKKAYAMYWRTFGPEPDEELAVIGRSCVEQIEKVLKQAPEHPYATNVWASCLSIIGKGEIKLGRDPTQFYQRAVARMEPLLQKYPHFLEGAQTLAYRYQDLAGQYQRVGHPELKATLERAMQAFAKALLIDPSHAGTLTYAMETNSKLVAIVRSSAELKTELGREEDSVAACRKALGEHFICDANRLVAYAAAAERGFRAGQDLRPLLDVVTKSASIMRKNELNSSEIEQSVLLARWVALAAAHKLEQDLADPTAEFRETQARCFALDKADPYCHMLVAQAAWILAEAADKPKAQRARLAEALEHAATAADHPLRIAAAAQTLAETQLRLAKLAKPRSKPAESALAAAEAALLRAFDLNPNLAAAHATQGRLRLLRASSQKGDSRRQTAGQALAAFKRALESDPLLAAELQTSLTQAKDWAEAK